MGDPGDASTLSHTQEHRHDERAVNDQRSAGASHAARAGGDAHPRRRQDSGGHQGAHQEGRRNPRAKEIYERGVAANHSFEDIERAISDAVPELKTPLIPKNVPWFTVRPDDFSNPAIASEILAAYGEDRGDGTKRLYRFPVVFPADMWQAVMPHELVAWGANEKKYWSEYTPDGRVRYCKCYAPVPMDDTGKRAIRIFGGRKTALRQENGGLCDPELCGEYQNRQCNLSGRFIFFIPGIKSIGAFELHTNSFYAMNAAIQKFETIAFMRGGRISGFLDSKRTSFFYHQEAQGSTAHRRAEARGPGGALDHRPRSADRRHRALARQRRGRDRDR